MGTNVVANYGTGTIISGIGDSASTTAMGQSFTSPSSSFSCGGVSVRLARVNSPTDNLFMDILSSNSPEVVIATSDAVASASIPTTEGWINFNFSTPPTLSASTTYYLKVRRSGGIDGTNEVNIYGNGGYAGGTNYTINGSATWTSLGSDWWFNVWSGPTDFFLSGLSSSVPLAGPFKSSGGAFYLFGRDGTTSTTLQAYKSTNPVVSASSSSWASIATNTGFSTAVQYVAGFQSGTIIYLAVIDGATTSVNLKYRTFDTSSDTFVTSETVQSAFNPQDTSSGNVYECAIVFRSSDSQPIIAYNGARTANMGASYARIVYARRTGVAAWSANNLVGSGGTQDERFPAICNGSSDRVHFGWKEALTIASRTLTSGNVLQTTDTEALTSISVTDQKLTFVSYNDGGTTRVILSIRGGASGTSTSVVTFDSADTYTLSADILVETTSIGILYVDLNNLTAYCLYDNAGTTTSVESSTDDGATWGSKTTAMTTAGAATNFSYGAIVYQSGNYYVIPYVINDNGTLRYNEYVLSFTAPTTWSDVHSSTWLLPNKFRKMEVVGY